MATAPVVAGADPDPGAGSDLLRRLTWLMLLRVVVTTLLLGAAVVADAAAPAAREGPWTSFVFGLLAVTYGFTLLWALLLRRGVDPVRIAPFQIACDAAAAALLVHGDGGAESGFVALYLMVIVGGAVVLPRRAASLAGSLVCASYLAIALLDRLRLLPPLPTDGLLPGPAGPFIFTVAKNLVFFAAAFALARRLAGELERAGQVLAAQGARFDELAALHADVVRSMTSGLLTLSDEGVVGSLNPAGEEILGLRASQLLGRSLSAVYPEIARLVPASASASGAPKVRGEVAIARPDGDQRIVGLNVATLVGATGSAVGRMVNFQDLTELRRMQERIERTDRLAAIGRLAAGIAHEIRNPLAAISGSIELLSPSIASDDESRDLIAIVTREVDRLNRLITELLDFARPRPPAVAPLEVGTTLHEILRVVENDRRLNPVANRFQLHIPSPIWIDADPGQLRQVVLNLLLNAADATPGGEPIDLWAGRDGESAKIEVRDRGPGIPLEVRAHLFEPFFSTKQGGTGLGLATVHRIVEEHGGSIEIGPREGGGTIFTIRLPRREAAEA